MNALNDWLGTVSALQVIAFLGALIGLGVALRKAWPTIRAAVKLVDTLGDLPAKLERITHELEHNTGTSLKDAVKRTEDAVTGLDGRINKLAQHLEVVSEDVAHVKRQAASLKTSVARVNRRLAAVEKEG